MITEVGDEGSGLKGKAFQKDSPGLSTDSKGGRSFLNIGAQTGRGGGTGGGPPVNQLISARRDNPNGPEREKNFVTIDIERENCLYERDRGSLDLKDLYVASGKLMRKLREKTSVV